MPRLPEGVLTFLFTDIEGSTRLWELYPEAMRRAHARHQAIVTHAVETRGGSIVRARGEGDSTFCVFRDPAAAVRAACAMQRDLHRERWPEGAAIRVRAALHQGEAHLSFGDY
ncbi:MAG: hypothetical protein IT208_01020, partial [Chthonomonadales bacterium]|nr:hypothetical protein [Chthonomonadales bacterium]